MKQKTVKRPAAKRARPAVSNMKIEVDGMGCGLLLMVVAVVVLIFKSC